jgi:hypothetical protein
VRPVRVRKARRAGPLRCGHQARIGSQIVSRGHGWICATCAVRLALDAIRAARDAPPVQRQPGNSPRVVRTRTSEIR